MPPAIPHSPRRHLASLSVSRLSVSRLVAILGLFGMVLIAGGTAGFAFSERARLLRDAATQAESTAAFLGDHAGRLFEVADVALSATRAEFGSMPWDEVARSTALYAHMKAIRLALPYISNIWLNDELGTLRLTSLAFPSPASNAADRLSFQQVHPADSGLVVGELITAKLTGEKTFLVARRLEWPDGGFRGMVSATAELAYFGDYWSRLSIPYDGRVALMRSSLSETFVQYPASAAAPAAGGGADLVAASAVANVPLILRVTIPRAAVSDVWHRWLASYLPLAFAALLALLALTLLAFRQGTRDAASFAALRTARAALAQANAGLEATVASRTAELRATTEEVQQFAYLVSHDLRGPLLNVTGFAGEMAGLREQIFAPVLTDTERTRLAAEFDEMLGFIRAGTRKMDGLLRHVLALSREGQRTLRPETLDMADLVRGLADAQRYQSAQAAVAVSVGALPALVADRLAVEQIFGNLLDNAVKYHDHARPGRVAVSGRREGATLVYEVSDNGRGIAPADQARVFELFRRAGVQDTTGEGIGLAFVRALTRVMGGRVDVESALGVGTTFRITLPAEPHA